MAKICRNCNSQLMDSAVFCNHCGARVTGETFDSEKMKNCEHCGAVLYKNARYCTNCGLPVGVPEAQGYALRCERCGTWLKPGVRFCNTCGRRVNIVSYNFTQQPEAVPVPAAEPQQKPKVLPPLRKDRRTLDYDSTLELKRDFELPPIDEIVVPEPVEAAPEPEFVEAEIVSVPGEDTPVSLEKPKTDDEVIYSDAPVELVPPEPAEEPPVPQKKEPEDAPDPITGEIL